MYAMFEHAYAYSFHVYVKHTMFILYTAYTIEIRQHISCSEIKKKTEQKLKMVSVVSIEVL